MECSDEKFAVAAPVLALLVAILATAQIAAADGPDPAVLAKQILDDKRPEEQRKQLILDHPKQSLDLLKALVADMPSSDLKEEYRRIPWIWRVTVAAGKRNNIEEMKPIVAFCLPKTNEPLADWKTVVLGGGIINGIGLVGGWADEQIEKMIGDDAELQARWAKLLEQSAAMADNEKVFKGTRYDALRIVALDTWDHRGALLFRYLVRGVDDELQQGAIGGLGDMRSPFVGQALMSGFGHYNKENRNFAVDAMLREEGRTATLLDSIEHGTVKPADLSTTQVAKLTNHRDTSIRARGKKLLAGLYRNAAKPNGDRK